jgi:putative phosphoesterase
MRLGVISDIHSETERLAEALRLVKHCDLIVCAGDISDQSRFDARTVELLFEAEVLAIKGNNDFAACSNPLIGQSVSDKPEQKWLERLARLPTRRALTIDGLRLGLFHGSLWDDPTVDFFHYVFPESTRDITRVAAAGFDLVILGHTHRAMQVKQNGTLIVNPGSCGCGNPPSCAVIDTASRAVEFCTLKQ